MTEINVADYVPTIDDVIRAVDSFGKEIAAFGMEPTPTRVAFAAAARVLLLERIIDQHTHWKIAGLNRQIDDLNRRVMESGS